MYLKHLNFGIPYRLKFRWLLILLVKRFRRLKVTKLFKDFVTFHRQNFLTAFSDREENNFYLYFILFVFDFKINQI